MGAQHSLYSKQVSSRHQGFTIVELLIVIVVIGILAAISIIAYIGIQDRARVATIQTDLENVVKTMESYKYSASTSEQYPVDLATANLKASSGTTYQYTVNNAVSPATYCITASNGSSSNYVSSTITKPTSGACSGHSLASAPIITNLAGNPTLTTNSTGWVSTGDFGTGSRILVGGEWVFTATRTGTTAGVLQCSLAPCIVTTTSGNTYTATATVTSSVSGNFTLRIRKAGTTTILVTGPSTPLVANVPQRMSVSGVVNDTSVYLAVYSTAGAIGDVLTVDRLMFTEGSTAYNYADGDSMGWSWNGTPHASTSTGPALQ